MEKPEEKFKTTKQRIVRVLYQIFLVLLYLLILLLGGCDAKGDKEKEKKHDAKLSVEVKDLTPPTISSTEGSYTIPLGAAFMLDDYITVTDNVDHSLGYTCEGSFNQHKPGQYILLIKATDSSGNQAKKNITINVIEPQKSPVADQPATTERPQTSGNANSKENVEIPSSNQPATTKDFLYSDGFTLSSASDACRSELNASGRSGSCDPIEEQGIYTGMRLTLK